MRDILDQIEIEKKKNSNFLLNMNFSVPSPNLKLLSSLTL